MIACPGFWRCMLLQMCMPMHQKDDSNHIQVWKYVLQINRNTGTHMQSDSSYES